MAGLSCFSLISHGLQNPLELHLRLGHLHSRDLSPSCRNPLLLPPSLAPLNRTSRGLRPLRRSPPEHVHTSSAPSLPLACEPIRSFSLSTLQTRYCEPNSLTGEFRFIFIVNLIRQAIRRSTHKSIRRPGLVHAMKTRWWFGPKSCHFM